MLLKRRPWQEELEIVDRVMRSISDITEPAEMVEVYWSGVGTLIPGDDYVAISRRGVEPPDFLITRASRFTEHFNPWEERDRLPRLSGGVLGEVAYADRPLLIEDLPARLKADDPGHFYLEGFQTLIALPQYERGKGVNIGVLLYPPGVEFDRTFIPIMHWQASLFGRGTQSLVLRKQLTAALKDLDRELASVGEIQRSLLPRSTPEIPGFEIATSYATSAQAGGDYYDFFPLSNAPSSGGAAHDWGFFIADVSGHGTPAAVLMAITHAIAHTKPGAPIPPGELLTYLNGHLARSYTTAGTFVTAFYAALDAGARRLTYAVAGHNPPLVIRANEVITLDRDAGLPLGLSTDETYHDATFDLKPGDLLVLFTDGITEAMAPAENGKRALLGDARLAATLRACGTSSAAECVRRVEQAVQDFTGRAPATDDRTLVVVRVG